MNSLFITIFIMLLLRKKTVVLLCSALIICAAVLLIASRAGAVTTISTNVATDGFMSALGGYKVNGQLMFHASTTLSNIAIGYESLLNATQDEDEQGGNDNIALGNGALQLSTTGYRNVAVGISAMPANTTGNQNTGIGSYVLQDNTTGRYNTGIGYSALTHNATGNLNVGMGYGAGNGTSGHSYTGNTYLGAYTGFENSTGADYNTIVGYRAGYRLTTGSSNVIIGSASSSAESTNLTSGSQNILIGTNVSLPSATSNGQLNIGNFLYGSGLTGTGSTISSGGIGIGTKTPYNTFVVSDGGAGGLEIQPSVAGAARFISIDRSGGDIYQDFFFYQANGGMTLKAAGNVGIGTSTPATKLHISAGASATTTVSIGDLGLTTSKACVNMNRSNGQPASFFINAAGAIVVSTTYCE